jgi:hypothetical protein
MGIGKFTAGGKPCIEVVSHSGGEEILLATSCNGNQDKLQRYGSVDLTQTLLLPICQLIGMTMIYREAYELNLNLNFQ